MDCLTARQALRQRNERAASPENGKTTQRKHILVVDDEPRMCSSLKTLLKMDGYEIHTATSGQEALALIREHRFDMTLMDYVLPDLGGPQLITLLTAGAPKTPLIVMTGYATLDKAVVSLRRGAWDFITKPFNFDDLRTKVREAVQTGANIMGRQATPAYPDTLPPAVGAADKQDPSPQPVAASSNPDAELTIGEIAKDAFQVPPDMPVSMVRNIFHQDEPVNAVVVVGGREPLGLVMSIHLDRILSQRYGLALYNQKPICRIMDEKPLVIESSEPLEQVARQAMARSSEKLFDHLVVILKGQLVGTVSIRRLLITMSNLQKSRADAVEKSNLELKKALEQIKTLRGLLPICANCKKIRDDQGYWRQIESYISTHSEAEFSHSICPDCVKVLYPEFSGQ